MRTLPKRCLLNNVVIVSVNLCFYVLSKRSIHLPNVYFIIYNIVILTLSATYMRRDFGTDIFKLRFTASNIAKQVLIGLSLAFLLSLFFILIASIFEDISLFPQFSGPLDSRDIIFLVLLEIVVALAEEALFNYYLYDSLMLLLSQRYVLSNLVVAFIFAFSHWVLHGSVKQVLVAFVFRSFALLIREKFREDNAFYICSSMHFFYNLMAYFLFSI